MRAFTYYNYYLHYQRFEPQTINLKPNVIAGIDIGGTSTKLGLVDASGRILVQDREAIADHRDKPIDAFLGVLAAHIKRMLNEQNAHLKAVGLGAPNGNYFTGNIKNAPNLPWAGEQVVTKTIEKILGVPAKLTNDANAAAIGEMKYGNAKGMKNFIVLTLGTGVGSGIVSNGELIYGCDGFAGELGHSIVYHDGRVCSCGRQGCIEEYASVRGVKKTALELLLSGKYQTRFRIEKPEDLDPKNLSLAAQEGDELAIATYKETGRILGFKLADAANYTSPEAIIFFGGVAKAGAFLLDHVKKAFEEYALDVYKGKIKIIPSGLEESDAAILGAAALVSDL